METKFGKLMVLTVVLVIGLVASTVVADLVAYYPFNEGSGAIVADVAGGHNGLVNGDVQWVESKSGYGKALYFSGMSRAGHVDCGAWDPSEWTGKLTVAFWVRWGGGGGAWQGIVSKRNNWAADQMMWQIEVNRNSQQIAFSREGSYPNCGDYILSKGKWTHVAVTFDRTTMVFYVNGEVTGRDTFSFGSKTDSSIVIGASDPGGTNVFHGIVDEVCIFNNALSKDDITLLYSTSGSPFVSSELVALLDEVHQAKKISKECSPQEAVTFFEKKITEYKLWEKRNPKHVGLRSELLASDLYFLLAKAKKAANASTKDITEAYMKSALTSSRSPNYVPALLWLFGNLPADDYVEFVKKCAPNSNDAFYNTHNIARNFEASGNWAAFKLFLDAVFSEANDIDSLAKAIAKGLRKEGSWSHKFLEYCLNKPELIKKAIQMYEELAQENIQNEKFVKATKIYNDIMNQYSPDQDREFYELKVCECIFNSGQYAQAISKLDDFIKDDRYMNRTLVRQAVLLKGQAYLQLNELGRAYDTFSTLIIDDSETKQVPEANFFIGYCNMLGGKLEEAREVFSLVVKDYPQNPYAGKAHLCLRMVERMIR
jgi:tetratricopeptide (TPR) repeat protein